MAACGFCDRGHLHHQQYGGEWNYGIEDVDVSLDGREVSMLTPEQWARYQRAFKATAKAFTQSDHLTPIGEQVSLLTGPGPVVD